MPTIFDDILQDSKKTQRETMSFLDYLELLNTYSESKFVVDAQLGMANSFREKKDYRQALIEYQKVVDFYPETKAAAQAIFSIADIYDHTFEVRDYKRAVLAYGKVVADYPDSLFVERARQRKRYLEENYL